jgi:oligoribonuclease
MTERLENLVWIDLEMTGLNPDRDCIIEIATIVTDAGLRTLAEGPSIAIRQPQTALESMDEWNRLTHGTSGLLDRVRRSNVTTSEAEAATLEFLRQYSEPGASPMCGNSICQDRRFLAREMPTLEKFFHYRNLDVSSVKELARRWAPDVLAGLRKNSAHLALDDIRESIRELEYYRQTLFRAL